MASVATGHQVSGFSNADDPACFAVYLRPTYLTTELGIDTNTILGLGASAVLSPDGTAVAFVALPKAVRNADAIRIYLRPLDQLHAVPVRGTERGREPFFSPDGQWIGFFADGKLKKVSIDGGPVVTLADAPRPRGGTWAEDGTIIFAPGRGASLVRVSSAGGSQQVPTSVVPEEVAAAWPQLLPGDGAVLFTRYGQPSTEDNAALAVQPLPSAPLKVIQRGGYFGRYVSSGHLLYIRGGALFAMPFDVDRLQASGPAVPAVDHVQGILPGGAEYSFSQNGTLLFYSGAINLQRSPMSWMDSSGKTTALWTAARNWRNAVFAPDGRRLAFQISEDGQTDVWMFEWERDALSRLTVDGAANTKPVWAPGGRAIAFASRRDGNSKSNLYWQRTDGTGDVTRLTDSKNNQYPTSWHSSGKFLAFDEDDSTQGMARPWFSTDQTQSNANVMILSLEGDEASGWKPGKPITFLNTRFNESEATFSPDGRWVAYMSNETGRSEIYVRAFPGPGMKWLISSGGGGWPIWSRTKNELFFVNDDVQLMVASYTLERDSFRPEKPRLFSDVRVAPRAGGRLFDLHPDGERFVVAGGAPTRSEAQTETRSQGYVFVFNFLDELRRLAPPKR